MAYTLLRERDADAKLAMAVVSPTLRSNQKAFARHKMGNLAFVEVRTSAPPDLKDKDGSSTQYVAVILGTTPRVVNLPNKAIFVHFAKNIRSAPDKLELKDRIRTALLLATGSSKYIGEPEALAPTWTDKGGTLVIRYHKNIGGGGMMRPQQVACTLTVDAEQAFTHHCGEPE